jgi:hypothetical protein
MIHTNTLTDYGYSKTELVKGETLEAGGVSREVARLIINHCTKVGSIHSEHVTGGIHLAQFCQDIYVNSILWHVRMMLTPPADLFHPYVIHKVATAALKEKIKRAWLQ